MNGVSRGSKHANGIALFHQGRLHEALAEFLAATHRNPGDWSAWYWAGQCERFDLEFESAHEHLSTAQQLAPDETSVLLAHGIVLQLLERFEEAVRVLARAIEVDADFATAYNSLGVTQRKMGELDKALHNYDGGTKALARKFVRTASNSERAPIIPYEDVPGSRWMECAMFGAMFSAASAPGIQRVAFPMGESAEEEARSRAHGGLLWVDSSDIRDRHRVFLPNYFHAFREYLKADGLFAHLIGNQGTIHELRGDSAAAAALYAEAKAFTRRAAP